MLAVVGMRPEFLTFEGAEGAIGALRWGGVDDAPTLVAVHGITANAWHFDPFAHHLAGAANVVAVDLRGRGRSFAHPGPYGMRSHAADLAAVIEQLHDGPLLLVGHSMGCYASLMAAKQRPDLVRDLLLVDGGTPIPVPDGADVDELLDVSLGPAIERLRNVWSDRVSYLTMWRQHPAFAGGISIDLERNLLADLAEVDGGFRTTVAETAVRADGRELLADTEVRSLLADREQPTTIVRAELGLMAAPPPLIPVEVRDALPQHRWVEADGFNHYDVLLGPAGARLVADQVRTLLAAEPTG